MEIHCIRPVQARNGPERFLSHQAKPPAVEAAAISTWLEVVSKPSIRSKVKAEPGIQGTAQLYERQRPYINILSIEYPASTTQS
jgi:hypothetical protein